MSQIGDIARHEVTALVRERVFHVLLGVFLLMVFLSAFIGWETLANTSAVYDASVALLHRAGMAAVPANPVVALPPLAVFRNIIIYVFLLGSLMAIFVGHRSIMRERMSGTLPLLLSRPLSPLTLLLGKLGGLAGLLLFVCTASFLVSLLTSRLLPFGQLSGGEVGRLLLFYLLSFLYLMLFAGLGLLFALISRSESLALLAPAGIWVALSFVLPELTTGQTPTALLNPVTLDQSLSQAGAFAVLQRAVSPFSLGLHYTTFSSQLLDSTLVRSDASLAQIIQGNLGGLAALAVALAAVAGLSLLALGRQDLPMKEVHE